MFTGIITDIGEVLTLEGRGDLRATIGTALDMEATKIGASIACSGACLTVVDKGSATAGGQNWFAVDISQETLDCTTLGAWQPGTRVNLEAALALGEELGGHLVSGHIDGIATLCSVTPEGDSHRLLLSAPAPLARFIAPKGSLALDGISLTVNDVADSTGADTTGAGVRFGVNIIPHTQVHTTLGAAGPGATLNLEIDMIARYVARLTQHLETDHHGGA